MPNPLLDFYCIDPGNRTVQAMGAKSRLVESMPSLIHRSGRKAEHRVLEQTAFIDYLDGVHGTQYSRETVVLGRGAGRYGKSSKAVYKAESTPGSGKLQYLPFFVLGMLPLGSQTAADIGTIYTCHPEPTAEVIAQFREKLVGTHRYTKNGKLAERTILNVEVYPEGEPAYHWLVSSGTLNQELSNVIIDIGGLTAIASVYDDQGMMQRYVMRRGGTIDLATRIGNSIQADMPGEVADLSMIMDGMLNGSFQYGTRFSFESAYRFHAYQWTQDLVGEYMAQFDNLIDSVSRVAFVGGGARYLDAGVILPLENVGWFIPDSPENANTMGLLTLGLNARQLKVA
ncbi:MAG: ParM/StbA family protein [Stenomitos frigidus ULC029]